MPGDDRRHVPWCGWPGGDVRRRAARSGAAPLGGAGARDACRPEPRRSHPAGRQLSAPPGSPADIPGLSRRHRVACGESVTTWRAGDRVFGLVGGGGLSDTVAVHERHVARIPHNLTDREAAAVPEAFITAHDAVFTRAGLAMGETLLVNGASGGISTAAVQLGAATGARVLTNSRSHSDALVDLGAEPSRSRRPAASTSCSSWSARPFCRQPRGARGPRAHHRRRVGRRGRCRSLAAGLDGTARQPDGNGAAGPAHGGEGRRRSGICPIRRASDRVLGPAARYRSRVPGRRGRRRFDHLAAPGKLGKVLLELA